MQRDTHLATTAEDIDRAVVVVVEKRAVCRRRLSELVDFVAQRSDVLACFTQCVSELFVLRNGLRELALGFEQLFFERTNAFWRVLNTTAKVVDLFF